jgi:hypothetical protein
VASVKKTKIYPVNSHMYIQNLSFLYRTQKMFFFSKIFCMNIVCLDVHEIFLFQIFWYFEIYFLIIGSFAPVSRNEYPTSVVLVLCEFFLLPLPLPGPTFLVILPWCLWQLDLQRVNKAWHVKHKAETPSVAWTTCSPVLNLFFETLKFQILKYFKIKQI